MGTCKCGDLRRAHEHYRPGSDCSLCPCPRFRRRIVTGLSALWTPLADIAARLESYRR